MHKKRLSPFPGPFGKIPNFRGAREAAKKLLKLPEFQSAKSVEVNPDKPLEAVRALVLSNNKELYVPTPQLRGSLLKKLEKVDKHDVRTIVSRWGMSKFGRNISLEDKIKIDLLIVGCVAVSEDGYRIGKGKGFADLEFAVLKEMDAINDNTTIVAVVHDIQVYDKLDNELFKIHDVPVDYIVTPTKIIKTRLDLPKPLGIYWSLITLEKLNQIETLQRLKLKQESQGQTVVLKTEENDKQSTSNSCPNKRYGNRNVNRKQNIPNDTTTVDTTQKENKDLINEKTKSENVTQNKHFTSHRSFYRRGNFRKKEQFNAGASTSSEPKEANSQIIKDHTKKEDIENVPPTIKKPKKKNNGYSLIVSNIHREIKCQVLRNVLIEKGIKPNYITWKGFHGYCLLHYMKKNIKTDENGQKVPLSIDNVIELIQDININPDPSQKLTVKVKEPITRIETLDVTSV